MRIGRSGADFGSVEHLARPAGFICQNDNDCKKLFEAAGDRSDTRMSVSARFDALVLTQRDLTRC